jgi:hypothetical protein
VDEIEADRGPRFRDGRERIHDFVDEVLVRCPSCQKRAVVLPSPASAPRSEPNASGVLSRRRRMSCGFCGFVRDEVIGSFAVGGPVDPFFRCPLWLQTDCRGQVLWAYNERHLDVLETYVGA